MNEFNLALLMGLEPHIFRVKTERHCHSTIGEFNYHHLALFASHIYYFNSLVGSEYCYPPRDRTWNDAYASRHSKCRDFANSSRGHCIF